MDQNTKDAIEEYFKLKKKYEDKQQRTKRKITQDESLDKKTKRVALASLKTACVNCGKSGGTLFMEQNNTLRALCQAQPKCNLNLNIYRGSYNSFFALYNLLNNRSDTVKTNIVKTKLDLLFGFTAEDTAISQFEEYRTEFNLIEKDINDLHTTFVYIIQNNRNNTIIMEAKQRIDEALNRIELLLQEYRDTGDRFSITNIIKEYINEVLPEAKRLRENTYAQNEIEKVGECYILRQEPYLYTEIEIPTI